MKKFFSVCMIFLLVVLVLPISRVSAKTEEPEEFLTVEILGMTLETEFYEANHYIVDKSTENIVSLEIYDEDSNDRVAEFTLDFGNPYARATSSAGAYKKYLSSGLTLVHTFGFEHTGTGNSKRITALTWNAVNADGWSIYKKNSSESSVAIASSTSVTGSFSINIQATVNGSLNASITNDLKGLGFAVEVSANFNSSKTFYGGWTVQINSTGSQCTQIGGQIVCSS